jgi:hypothetical protein
LTECLEFLEWLPGEEENMSQAKVRAVVFLACVWGALTILAMGSSPALQEARAQENKERLGSLRSLNYPKTYI